MAAFFPLLDLADTATGVFIQRDVEPLDQLRVPTLDKVGHVLRVVLAGFGHIIAKALHDLVAYHVIVFFCARGGQALDLGVEVLPISRDLQQPGHVVDARDLPLHPFVIGHAKAFQQSARADLHAMAQADGLDAGQAEHRACQSAHGVGVVQKPGVRADFLHVPGKIQHHGDGAKRAEDAANAQGVGDGLAQAVLFGHLKVRDRAGVIQAHLDGVDHIVGPAQGLLAAGDAQIGFYICLGTVVVVDGLQHAV